MFFLSFRSFYFMCEFCQHVHLASYMVMLSMELELQLGCWRSKPGPPKEQTASVLLQPFFCFS